MLFFFYFNRNKKENDRFLQKNHVFIVAKCFTLYSFYSYLRSKFAKNAIMTTKNFFVQKFNMGIKNAEFYADFNFVCRLSKILFKKLAAKKHDKTCTNENLHSFLAITFWVGINEFKISIKFCVFWYPHWLFGKTFFGRSL